MIRVFFQQGLKGLKNEHDVSVDCASKELLFLKEKKKLK